MQPRDAVEPLCTGTVQQYSSVQRNRTRLWSFSRHPSCYFKSTTAEFVVCRLRADEKGFYPASPLHAVLGYTTSFGGNGVSGTSRQTGGAAIAMCLESNYSLTHLDLSWNKASLVSDVSESICRADLLLSWSSNTEGWVAPLLR